MHEHIVTPKRKENLKSHHMTPLINVLQTQQHKFVNWQCDAEYRGDNFTASVTLGNPDVLVGSGNIS